MLNPLTRILLCFLVLGPASAVAAQSLFEQDSPLRIELTRRTMQLLAPSDGMPRHVEKDLFDVFRYDVRDG